MKVLRQQGIFDVRHIANPITSYHERDLEVLRDKLLACSPKIKLIHSSNFIALEQCMLMKAGHDDIKASIVSAVLSKKLRPIGRAHENIGGMVILRANLEQFMLESKSQFFGSTTVVAAAKQLHCYPLVVENLYHDGLLSRDHKPNCLFLRQDSLDAFGEQYVSCAAIAAEQKTNSSKIVSLCSEQLINLHLFQRAAGKNPQPFVELKCC